MNKYRPIIIAGSLMLLLSWIGNIDAIARGLQIPSGWLAAFFLGAPAAMEDGSIRIFTSPQVIVSVACSGIRFFAFLAGLGGGYWCRGKIRRWLMLLPASYLITLFANAARIAMAWQFRRFSNGHLPGWLQMYVHIGIGTVCFLSVTAILMYVITPKPQPKTDNP